MVALKSKYLPVVPNKFSVNQFTLKVIMCDREWLKIAQNDY